MYISTVAKFIFHFNKNNMLVENKRRKSKSNDPIPVVERVRFRDGGTIMYQDRKGNEYYTGHLSNPNGIYDDYPTRGNLLKVNIKIVDKFK